MTVESPIATNARSATIEVGARVRGGAKATASVPDETAQPKTFSLLQWGCLLAIVAVAAGLRLLKLDDWSIWVDEGHTYRDVTVPLDQFFENARRWYPTSYLFLRGLLDGGLLPCASEGWLRLPFALCGIATVPVLALYGRHLAGPSAALFAALYLAVDPWHVYWSQNARAYSLVVLFGVIAAGEFAVGRQQGSRLRTALAFVWLALAASCHMTSIVLLPAFLVVLLLDSTRFERRRTIPLLLLVATLLLVLEPLLSLFPPFRGFLDAKQDASPSLWHWLQTSAFYFRLPLLAAATAGAFFAVRERVDGRTLHLLCWAIVPMVLLAAVGAGMVKVTARYALIALPGMLLLAGLATVRLFDLTARAGGSMRFVPGLLLPVLLCVDFLGYDYLYFTVQRGDRGRWEEASEFVQANAAGAPFVVHTTHEPVLVYYLQPDRYRAGTLASAPDVVDLRSIETHDIAATANGRADAGGCYVRSIVEHARRDGRVPFFVASMPELQEKDRDGSLQAALRSQCELLEVLPLWVGPKDESVYVWRAR